MADTDLPLPSRAATQMLSREDFLYPPLSPNRTGRLKLDSLHTMYWEESGNPRGTPVVFLHGGPGGGSAPDHRLRPARRGPIDSAGRTHRQHHAASGRRPRALARASWRPALAGVRRIVGRD